MIDNKHVIFPFRSCWFCEWNHTLFFFYFYSFLTFHILFLDWYISLFFFFRVSVPRSSLVSPHKFKPHRRASFDPTDSVGLSSHCLAGWESSKPTVIPMPSSLDLRTSLHKSRTTLVCPYLGATCTVYTVHVMRLILKIFLLFVGNLSFTFGVQLYLSIKFGHCVVIKGKAL